MSKLRRFAVATLGRTGQAQESGHVPHHHRLIIVSADSAEAAQTRGRADFRGNHGDGEILSCLAEPVPEQ